MRRPALLMLAALVLIGCARGEGASSRESLDEFLSLTRGSWDYEPAATPAELAALSDVVVSGRIVGVKPGQAYAPAPDADPGLVTSVIEVAVRRVLAGDASLVFEGSVYVEIAHPALVGEGYEGSPRRPFDHEKFAATVPTADGVFFLDDRTDEPYWDTILDEGAGRPAGAPITAPFVQGFLIEAADGGVVSAMEPLEQMLAAWHEIDSLEEVAAQADG